MAEPCGIAVDGRHDQCRFTDLEHPTGWAAVAAGRAQASREIAGRLGVVAVSPAPTELAAQSLPPPPCLYSCQLRLPADKMKDEWLSLIGGHQKLSSVKERLAPNGGWVMRRIEGVWEGESWRELWAAVQGALQRRDKLAVQRRLLSAQSRACSASSLSCVQWASLPRVLGAPLSWEEGFLYQSRLCNACYAPTPQARKLVDGGEASDGPKMKTQTPIQT